MKNVWLTKFKTLHIIKTCEVVCLKNVGSIFMMSLAPGYFFHDVRRVKSMPMQKDRFNIEFDDGDMLLNVPDWAFEIREK